MNRLTKDLYNQYKNYWYREDLEQVCDREQIVLTKLGQYEDLEEKLGINLFILFKALKNGVYVKNEYAYDYYEIEYKKVRGIEKTGLSAISNICEFPECDELLCYSNYGKFWALTEEELENVKREYCEKG